MNIAEFKYFKELQNVIKFNIMHAFHTILSPIEWNEKERSAPYNRLYFVINGSATLSNEKEKINLVPNSIYLIPAYSVYDYECSYEFEKIFIHFNYNIIPGNDLFKGLSKCLVKEISLFEMEQFKELFYSENPYDAIKCKNKVLDIVLDFIPEIDYRIKEDLKVYKQYDKIYEYVQKNVSAELTVSMVSKQVGFSKDYLGRIFKKDTKITIKEFIDSVLVDNLKHEFVLSGKKIIDIANEFKFSSEFYCSTFFKKHVGISPREYRKKHKIDIKRT